MSPLAPSVVRFAYRSGIRLLYVAAGPYLRRCFPEGQNERRGYYDARIRALGATRPLWVHAVSVGEVQAGTPFIRAARAGGYEGGVLLSTVTVTGRAMAQQLLGESAVHAYAPWDVPEIVERALDAICPRAYITVETEIWPALVEALDRRRIPLFLLNGRVSDRTFRRGMRWRDCWEVVLNRFSKLLMRSSFDAERILAMGASPARVDVIGDCKVDAIVERRDSTVAPFAGEPSLGDAVFVAGSTHPGEDEIVLDAFVRLKRTHPEVRLILAPRHPERAAMLLPAARAAVDATGGEAAGVFLLSEDALRKNWSILVIDRVGVLFFLYRFATAAFVGGSLVPKGGQNLLEPAAWGVPIVHGPHMEDFAEASANLRRIGAAEEVTGAEDLALAWGRALAEGRSRGLAGRRYIEGIGGGASAAWRCVASYIDLLR